MAASLATPTPPSSHNEMNLLFYQLIHLTLLFYTLGMLVTPNFGKFFRKKLQAAFDPTTPNALLSEKYVALL